MPGFNRLRELVYESYSNGKNWYSTFRKVPAIASTQGIWMDLSMAPGSPRPNYYTSEQYISAILPSRYGLFHGMNVGGKYLHKLMIGCQNAGVAPATFILCDYLMYYPLIDMDDTSEQILTNSISLPRYSDGLGVKAFLVATNPFAGGAQFQIKYTNSDGVSDRFSAIITSNSTTNISTIVHSGAASTSRGPFIPLQLGDKGIRSVESVQFQAPNGGLATLVLCKPLATLVLREITAVSETDFVFELPSLPKIEDGAYLNFLMLPNGSVAAQQIFGEISTIWN
jgi:hypothetical protein